MNRSTILYWCLYTLASGNKMRRGAAPEIKSLSQFYKPKTINQENYVKALEDPGSKILFVTGPAGTGKTALACNQAIQDLKSGKVNKIILTRPVVPVEEEELGFLPGNINKKMDPWTRPIFDIFHEFYAKKDVETMVNNQVIEISPLAFMRGRTFKNAFIIADEMQNSSPNQMLMVTTRIGLGSKMVVTGDMKQSDRGNHSGLSDFIERYKKYMIQCQEEHIGIKLVELTAGDIERSKVIKKLLEIYDFQEPVTEKRTRKYNKVRKDEGTIEEVPTNENTKRDERIRMSMNNDAALIPVKDVFISDRMSKK